MSVKPFFNRYTSLSLKQDHIYILWSQTPVLDLETYFPPWKRLNELLPTKCMKPKCYPICWWCMLSVHTCQALDSLLQITVFSRCQQIHTQKLAWCTYGRIMNPLDTTGSCWEAVRWGWWVTQEPDTQLRLSCVRSWCGSISRWVNSRWKCGGQLVECSNLARRREISISRADICCWSRLIKGEFPSRNRPVLLLHTEVKHNSLVL